MQQSRAIVLHQIKYAESSLILKIYTENEGLLSFIVKGVRGKKGKLRSAQFQVLNLLNLSYKEGKKSGLRTITDLKIAEPFSDLLFDPVKRSIGLFLAELIQHCIKEEEPNVDLFDFLYSSIHWLDLTKTNCTHFHLFFMMKLSKHLGFSPNPSQINTATFFDLQQGVFLNHAPPHLYHLEGAELEAWKELIACQADQLEHLFFSNSLKRRLVQALMDYYKLHLVHFKELNSHHILQLVFSDE